MRAYRLRARYCNALLEKADLVARRADVDRNIVHVPVHLHLEVALTFLPKLPVTRPSLDAVAASRAAPRASSFSSAPRRWK